MANDYTLILGDCLDKMSQIEDGSIDMICADLPYGTTACKWDVVIPFEPLWKQYKRVIKRNGVVVLFGSGVFSFMLWASNPQWFKYRWIWDKGAISNFQQCNIRPLAYSEDVLIFGKDGTTYNPQMTLKDKPLDKRNWRYDRSRSTNELNHFNSKIDKTRKVYTESFPSDILRFNAVAGECNKPKRLHPTQKPVALLSYLILTYTNPGETVLDNVFGSCSTGEACLREGRRFIGIEKDEGYYQIGADRLVRVAAELRGEFVPRPTKKPVEDLPMFQRVG